MSGARKPSTGKPPTGRASMGRPSTAKVSTGKPTTGKPGKPAPPSITDKKPKPPPIVKVNNETFRGLAPGDQNLVQVYVPLPTLSTSSFINADDPIVKKALDTIRDQYKVWINVDESGEYWRVEGANIQNAAGAMREVRQFLSVQAEKPEGVSVVVAHRVGGSQTDIELKRVVEVAGVRFGLAEGSWRGVALPGTTEETLAEASQQNMAKKLFGAIQTSFRSIRPDVGHKYVRVFLGLRTLSKKLKDGTIPYSREKKNEDQTLIHLDPDNLRRYDTAQFASLLEAATKRGHSYFDLRFGDQRLAKKVLDHIYETERSTASGTKFVPTDATSGRLEQVKPQFTLIFISLGWRIEMDVQFEPIAVAATASIIHSRSLPSAWNRPTAAPPRIFRTGKHIDAAVVVPCPDLKVDFQLSVEADLSPNKIHDRFRTLAKELRFDNVEAGTSTFPILHVSRASLLKAGINGIAMKVYRTFEVIDAPFKVQVATYYDWANTPLHQYLAYTNITEYDFGTEQGCNCPLPTATCAVSLFGSDWDNKIRHLNPASMDFSDELMKLFYQKEMLEQHGEQVAGEMAMADLLRQVDYLANVTSRSVVELEIESASKETVDELLSKFPLTKTGHAADNLNKIPAVRNSVHSSFVPLYNYGPPVSVPDPTQATPRSLVIPVQDPTQAKDKTATGPSAIAIGGQADGQADDESPIEPTATETGSLMNFGPDQTNGQTD